jgi:hypothetical protein
MIRQTYVTGGMALDATLASLSGKIADTAIKAGVRSALSVVTKGIKAEMPSKLRKTIGNRFKVFARGKTAAVSGAAVKKDQPELVKRKRPGVGISARNIHWWIKGTTTRQTSKGANRGAMPAHSVVPPGFAKSQGPAMAKGRLQIARTIERETIKEAARNRSKG